LGNSKTHSYCLFLDLKNDLWFFIFKQINFLQMTSNNNNKMGFTHQLKLSITSIASAVCFLLVFPVGISATEGNQGGIDPEYSLRLNDSEAGFYYFERVVDSEEGPVLEIGMELHDQKTMGRYGCEQTLRKVVQDLAEMGIMSEEERWFRIWQKWV